jgi:uncharacterized membrane protein (DUF2068 family)
MNTPKTDSAATVRRPPANPSAPAHKEHPTARRRALRAIAVTPLVASTTAIAASVGLLSLLHHDLHRLAVMLIGHFGLDPGGHYPSLLVHYADVLEDTNRRQLFLLAAGYVVLRLAEAHGLWYERAWGEWLGALSGALYVPFELRHLLHAPSPAAFVVLGVNLAIVAFLAWQLWRGRMPRGDASG